MPVLSSTALLNNLISRTAVNATSNATSSALQVVCAWPVSGQYGPGSRVLYYVLVAACIVARRFDWLRNACLAAALLFPAVAALHGITLAAVHDDDAVDMDVYGAFQLCSIGILAAPVMVRHTTTYWNDPGRNLIFLWTGLILAGLLSLTVEFLRIKSVPCPFDDYGNQISSNIGAFLSSNATCGLTCSVDAGPFSPMRRGSANNIYVIPAPDRLTFDTATLIAAACCIPAILSLISMWTRIRDINWKSRFGNKTQNENADQPIEGTNGATVEKMRKVNSMISFFLSAVEIPVFGAAVFAILIIGERNFFSTQVWYQTEPIASIGQWAPIVGSGMAVLGSLYLLLVAQLSQEYGPAGKNKDVPDARIHHCDCSGHGVDTGLVTESSPSISTPRVTSLVNGPAKAHTRTSSEVVPTITTSSRAADGHRDGSQEKRHMSWTSDAGNRLKVARALTSFANYLGTADPNRHGGAEFRGGKADDFPEIPGEEARNSALPQIREQYNRSRGDLSVTSARREHHSRASSFNGSDIENNSTTPRTKSRSPSPFTVLASPERSQSNTLPFERTSFDLALRNTRSISGTSAGGRPLLQRPDTLEVPSPVHRSHTRRNLSISSVTQLPGPSSPVALTSSDPHMNSASRPSAGNPPTPTSPSNQIPTPPTTASLPSR